MASPKYLTALRKGDRDFRHFHADPDLATLKDREDFRDLLMEMAFATDPIAR